MSDLKYMKSTIRVEWGYKEPPGFDWGFTGSNA